MTCRSLNVGDSRDLRSNNLKAEAVTVDALVDVQV
jgi:hypothetical protein